MRPCWLRVEPESSSARGWPWSRQQRRPPDLARCRALAGAGASDLSFALGDFAVGLLYLLDRCGAPVQLCARVLRLFKLTLRLVAALPLLGLSLLLLGGGALYLLLVLGTSLVDGLHLRCITPGALLGGLLFVDRNRRRGVDAAHGGRSFRAFRVRVGDLAVSALAALNLLRNAGAAGREQGQRQEHRPRALQKSRVPGHGHQGLQTRRY